MKKCYKCKLPKPLTEFHQSKTSPQGVRDLCRECCTQYYIDNAEAIEARIMAVAGTRTVTEKPCPRCGEVKSAEEFSPNRKRMDGLSVYCRACEQKRAVQYRKDKKLATSR